jgi:hypothetical protein
LVNSDFKLTNKEEYEGKYKDFFEYSEKNNGSDKKLEVKQFR